MIGNLVNGAGVTDDAAGSTIGGTSAGRANVFAFNSNAGLVMTGSSATANLVLGNFFGTNASGANLGNVVGILANAGGNTIGGTSAGAANVFGFNTTAGIQLPGTNNLVIGNLFGTNASGANVGNVVGLSVQGQGNTIGGATSAAANVIGFNTSEGILISGDLGANNTVVGNFIGTNASGANLGNTVGISLAQGHNTIGGTTAGMGNVFGFNSSAGLIIMGVGATDETVIGNLFGTNAAGANLGNAVGVLLQTGNNTIGGTSAGAANVFGFNTVTGLRINGPNEVVVGNLFGTSAGGANLGNAVGIVDNTGGNTIGGTSAQAANVVGFNTTGLQINGSNDSVVGNFFGTDANGANLANAVGVLDQGGSNTIGGISAALRTSSASARRRAFRSMARTTRSLVTPSAPMQVARIWATRSAFSPMLGATRSEEPRPARPTSLASTPQQAFNFPERTTWLSAISSAPMQAGRMWATWSARLSKVRATPSEEPQPLRLMSSVSTPRKAF